MVITEVANVYSMPEGLFEEDEWGSCSIYSGAVSGCARRVNLNNQRRSQEPSQLVASGDKVDARHVGTIFHKIMEHYHGDGFSNIAFRIADKHVQGAADHAMRLYTAYRARVPVPDFYGEVMAYELTLPRTAEERDAIHDYLGVSPWKGTIDLVFRADEESCKRCESLGLDITPGLYILDYKTHTSKSRHQEQLFLQSIQRMAYTYVGKEFMSEWGELKGMIACHLTWTKKPQLSWQLTPPCSRHEEKILKYTLQFGKELLSKDLPNPTSCVSRYGICPYLEDGSCSRC